MGRRNKLQKFAELLTFPNVYENYDAKAPKLTGLNGALVDMKGKWNKEHFNNDKPITLELACGKGDYAIGLAQRFPNRNFIGVDIKGARIWRGAKNALNAELENVAFLRTRIEQINHFFEQDEIDEIWITFPDPFLKKPNRRLTAINFLKAYQRFLKKDGLLHLKTDSPELYEFTMEEVIPEQNLFELIYEHHNIYSEELFTPELEIKTFYEKMHLADGRLIKYIRMKNNGLSTDKA